jgi:hypothetical protein
MTKIIMSK